MEKNLERLQIQGDNSIVLFAWAVLKTSISDTEDAMEYCNNIMSELIQKRVFKSLHHILIAKIFDVNIRHLKIYNVVNRFNSRNANRETSWWKVYLD